MLSKNQQKLVRALAQKKYRKQHGLYLVQGEKNVLELLQAGVEVQQVFATPQFISTHQTALKQCSVTECDEQSLSKVSTLVSNNAALAIVPIPETKDIDNSGLVLALDGVSDPGNLGTIIRLADWYGLKQVVVSEDCADHLNPKVISATMGSFVRVNVVRTDLNQFLSQYDGPIYGAYLDGQSVHKTTFSVQGVLVMGSESHGIREQAGQYVNQPITIPAYGQAESLNVAMATGIILDNFRRSI
ncbi:RNA methyltransferase [Pseudoalteromonas luteoviolacea CPMOR-1]|uniref:RNA methyltransferase n=1 Tax=Pseudoalteromonas luteoviolacea CPMOR-1 TaxID=1365248 RepID=A0A167J9I9_9GAMM|nr:RNA methyltransferase [Pseudoalteromonas luteoviolacea]KZN60805.1 RNA methyltransferase [Pseudoalteromonas luteoviolacea CPMOR-1]